MKSQSPLALHRMQSDDDVTRTVVPVSDWGSIFDKDETKVSGGGFEGWLHKKTPKMGGLPSRWIRRYFLFDEEKNQLMYWGTKGERERSKPKGCFLASDFVSIIVPDSKKFHRFNLTLRDKFGDRLLQLRADKEFELKQWVDVLKKHVALEGGRKDSGEEFTGEWTAQKCIELMNRGQKMTAYFTNGDRRAIKIYCRSLCVYVCHVNGTPNQPILQIPLRAITDIYVGKQTPGFSTPIAQDVEADRCFSVKSKQYTIDVEATSPHQTLGWLKGLQYLLTNSGKSVLYDEEDGAPKSSDAPSEGHTKKRLDGVKTPPPDEDESDEKDLPPPLSAEGEDAAASPHREGGKSTAPHSESRGKKATPAPKGTPISPLGAASTSYDHSSIIQDRDEVDKEIKRLSDRLEAVEKERDSYKARCEVISQKLQSGSSGHDIPATYITTSTIPSLVNILDKYRSIVTDEMAHVVENCANYLAVSKQKKIAKRHYRKAGIILNRILQESWDKMNQYFNSLVSRTVGSVPAAPGRKAGSPGGGATGDTKHAAPGGASSLEQQDRYLSRLFIHFLNYLNSDLYPLPLSSLAQEILVICGLSGKAAGASALPKDSEKLFRELIEHVSQVWWWLLVTQEVDASPVWKEDLVTEYYVLVTDTQVKDGTIRYPPIVSADGQVLMKGESRPPRKGGSKLRKDKI